LDWIGLGQQKWTHVQLCVTACVATTHSVVALCINCAIYSSLSRNIHAFSTLPVSFFICVIVNIFSASLLANVS